jgi:pterin-4a-carbinolamine dehydratase
MKTEDKSDVSEGEIRAVVGGLEGWSYDVQEKTLIRQWKFDKYVPTMAFIRKLTEVMDQENHHSDLSLDGRSKTLTVRVTTFSKNAVTRADLEFAEAVSRLSL